MSAFQLATPVAFLIFNRPDTAARVFEAIADAKPPRLLVVGDGPRLDRPDEARRVAETRAIIKRVDWPCEVSVNYVDANLGCKRRISSGLDWVFEQVEEAIILEDDCLPDPSFFRFCEELLVRYRDDQRIGMISGDNFQRGQRRDGDSYYFSRYAHIWGWACWRDRWRESYDAEMTSWPLVRDGGWLTDAVGEKDEARFWRPIFDSVSRGGVDTWDLQWMYANWVEGRLAVLPNVNLVSNIGFGPDGAHTTTESDIANMPTEPMIFPLRHPPIMIRNARDDRRAFQHIFMPPLHRRVHNKIGRIFRKIRGVHS